MKAAKVEQVTEDKKTVVSGGAVEAKAGKAPAKSSKETAKKETEKKEAVKTEPAKKETVKAEPAKKEAVKAEPEKKEAEKAEPAKKEAEKAEPAKKEAEPVKEKTPAKKTPVKKTAVKPAAKAAPLEVAAYVQYGGKEISQEDIVGRLKAIWTGELGKEEKDLKSIKIYIKPEENAVYYVINGEETGKIDF